MVWVTEPGREHISFWQPFCWNVFCPKFCGVLPLSSDNATSIGQLFTGEYPVLSRSRWDHAMLGFWNGLWHPISRNGFESSSVNPTFAWKPEFFADIFLFQACTFGGQHGREWDVCKSQPKSPEHSGLVRNDFNFSFFFSEIAQMPWHFIHFRQMMINEHQIPSPYASITALSTSRCQASEKLPEFSVTQVSLWSS